MAAAERAFDPSTRAAIQPPGPLESAEEAGIRRAEVDVDTRGADAQDSDELATQLGGVAPTTSGRQPDATRLGGVGGTQVAGAAGTQAAATQMGGAPTAVGSGVDADTASIPRTGDTPTGVPTREGEKRGVSGAVIGGIAAAALVLAIVGFLVGKGGGGGEEQPQGTSSAQSGAITITYPSSWERSSSAPEIPGVEFTNPITVGPKGQPNNRLTTGLVDASGSTLLPAAFVKSLGADPDTSDTVRLGDFQAYRYRNLDPGGFTPALTLYAVPTDKGVATVACTADAAQAAQFLPECERAASTLELDGAKPFDLGLGPAYVDAPEQHLQAPPGSARCRAQGAEGREDP